MSISLLFTHFIHIDIWKTIMANGVSIVIQMFDMEWCGMAYMIEMPYLTKKNTQTKRSCLVVKLREKGNIIIYWCHFWFLKARRYNKKFLVNFEERFTQNRHLWMQNINFVWKNIKCFEWQLDFYCASSCVGWHYQDYLIKKV